MNTKTKLFAGCVGLVLMPLVLLNNGCTKSSHKPKAELNTELNTKLEAVRQAGYPVTLAELNAWYPQPPPEENAATVYQEAFNALAWEDEKSPMRWDDQKSPSLLAKNQKALALLHQAASRTKCRYPIDWAPGMETRLPHLQKLKQCVQLLAQESVAYAGKGQMDLAARSILDGVHLARSLEQEPALHSQLTRGASEGWIILNGLESALSLKAFTDEQLARLQAAFREAGDEASLTRAFVADRCMMIDFFQLLPKDQARMFAQLFGVPAGGFDAEAYRKSSAYNADFSFYLDQMDRYVRASALPFPNSLEAIRQSPSPASEATNITLFKIS